jgi:hypothetical protein
MDFPADWPESRENQADVCPRRAAPIGEVQEIQGFY